MTLDQAPLGQPLRIVAIGWDTLVSEEAQRLSALGFEPGVEVAVAYRGVFLGRDPLAIEIGRMTVALRRVHARAIRVEPAAAPQVETLSMAIDA